MSPFLTLKPLKFTESAVTSTTFPLPSPSMIVVSLFTKMRVYSFARLRWRVPSLLVPSLSLLLSCSSKKVTPPFATLLAQDCYLAVFAAGCYGGQAKSTKNTERGPYNPKILIPAWIAPRLPPYASEISVWAAKPHCSHDTVPRFLT